MSYDVNIEILSGIISVHALIMLSYQPDAISELTTFKVSQRLNMFLSSGE